MLIELALKSCELHHVRFDVEEIQFGICGGESGFCVSLCVTTSGVGSSEGLLSLILSNASLAD